jgi:calcineurin-like phosphoesterase family protein
MATLVTSDNHFLHTRLVTLDPTRRKLLYKGLSGNDIDELMIKEWNAKVNDNDLIVNLGDFAYWGRNSNLCIDKCQAIFNRLNGRKILVVGNHEYEDVKKFKWESVIEQLVLDVNGIKILCRHYPLYDPLPKGIYGVFHGHIHTGWTESLIAAGEDADIPSFNLNCCVEATDFKPLYAEEALEKLNKQLQAAGWWPWNGGPNPLREK